MSSNSTKKASGIFATLLIGLIVVSFMFSGYESMRSTPDTIAKVGSKLIKVAEYQQELDRQMRFFSAYYNGGKPLSRMQIEQFGLKKNAMKSILSRKYQLIAGEEVGIFIGDHQVQEEVMNYSEPGPDKKPQKIFFTNGQFDLVKYKQLIQGSGRFTPASFEEMIRSNLELEASNDIFSPIPLSNNYMSEYGRMKSDAVSVDAIKIDPSKLSKFVNVTAEEVKKYLESEINLKRIEAVYKERKNSYDKPERVKARHILLKKEGKHKISIDDLKKQLTAKNFESLAKKYSEEPNADKSGGSLGWFERGKMVPEFEKVAFELKKGQISAPVKTQFGTHIIFVEDKSAAVESKFEDYRTLIATEQIKKDKSSESKALLTKIVQDIQKELKNKNLKNVREISKEYGLQLEENKMLSQLEGSAGSISFKMEQAKEIFTKSNNEVVVFDKDPMQVLIVMTKGKAVKEVNLEQEKRIASNGIQKKLQGEITKKLEDEIGYKIYGEL